MVPDSPCRPLAFCSVRGKEAGRGAERVALRGGQRGASPFRLGRDDALPILRRGPLSISTHSRRAVDSLSLTSFAPSCLLAANRAESERPTRRVRNHLYDWLEYPTASRISCRPPALAHGDFGLRKSDVGLRTAR